MKVFITGVAGTGKSTIAKALTERGITTVDFSDYPALRYWRNKITKKKSDYSPNNDMSWFDDHECVCDLDELKKLFEFIQIADTLMIIKPTHVVIWRVV